MISFLKGEIVSKQPTKVVLDVAGVGYEVIIPLSTYDRLPALGNNVTLVTHYVVREDAHILYGFIDSEEREVFRYIIQVNRVGPKVGLAILSHMSAGDFRQAVLSEDLSVLEGISGVGKKTSERIIMELKEKLPRMTFSEKMNRKTGDASVNGKESILADAVVALESLGFKRNTAYKACLDILKEEEPPVEELVRIALRRMSV